MSYIGDIYIEDIHDDIYALIFRKNNGYDYTLYAFVPRYIKNNNVKIKLDGKLFVCNLFTAIEELSICIYSIDYDNDNDNKNIECISFDIDSYSSNEKTF